MTTKLNVRTLLLLSGVLLMAGCAPRLQEIGPDIDQPHLTADSIHTADGIDLPLREWLPRDDSLKVNDIKAVVIAVHGFNDYSNGIRIQASDNTTALRAMGRDRLVIKDTRIDAAYGLVGLMSRGYRAIPVLGRSDRQVPRCLLLYGGREQVLNDQSVRRALSLLPDRPPEQLRLGLYPNGYHYLLRDLDAQVVFSDIASWMEDPRRPLPSGADKVPPKELSFSR